MTAILNSALPRMLVLLDATRGRKIRTGIIMKEEEGIKMWSERK
jgi:hypothetical protein